MMINSISGQHSIFMETFIRICFLKGVIQGLIMFYFCLLHYMVGVGYW